VVRGEGVGEREEEPDRVLRLEREASEAVAGLVLHVDGRRPQLSRRGEHAARRVTHALDDDLLRVLALPFLREADELREVAAQAVPRGGVEVGDGAHVEDVENVIRGPRGPGGGRLPGRARVRRDRRLGRQVQGEDVGADDVEAVGGEHAGDDGERAGNVGGAHGHGPAAAPLRAGLEHDVAGAPHGGEEVEVAALLGQQEAVVGRAYLRPDRRLVDAEPTHRLPRHAGPPRDRGRWACGRPLRPCYHRQVHHRRP